METEAVPGTRREGGGEERGGDTDRETEIDRHREKTDGRTKRDRQTNGQPHREGESFCVKQTWTVAAEERPEGGRLRVSRESLAD